MQPCRLSNEELFDELKTGLSGLASGEAVLRLERHGPNEIVEEKKSPLVLRFLANLYHVFALLLWVAGFLAFVAGMAELGWAIIAVIFLNAGFSFWQEYQAEQAVEALKKMLPAQARVVRDGALKEVPALELVPGDIVVLQEGDNVSADSRLLEENAIRINAAALTGESEPVRRVAGPVSGEGLSAVEIPNLVLTGTSVAFGSGKAVVYATGMGTEFGKIAAMTQKVRPGLSPLQKEVNRVALVIAAVALVMGAALFGVAALFTPLSLGVAAIFAIGMLVANVPEGLLPTVTLSLAMAVKKMARENAIVKRLSGVETLGSTSVICTDKTGTLTQNEMTVKRLWANGLAIDVGGVGYQPLGDFTVNGELLSDEQIEQLGTLMRVAALCNNARLREPSGAGEKWGVVGDPTEAALLVAARKWGLDLPAELAGSPRRHELPFDSGRKRMSVIHDVDGSGAAIDLQGSASQEEDDRTGGSMVAFIKGAPREVLSLCSRALIDGKAGELDDSLRQAAGDENDEMARSGLRVLAMAYRVIPADTVPEPEEVERDLTFVGLMAMMDPPRPEVETAIKNCRSAGIRVIMITGDYGLTAESVARRIGLLGGARATIVNGADIDGMTDAALEESLKDRKVLFARVAPEHKMRIAAALKEMGKVVAMTGDGVNDAPALKRADIGVAMGVTGTDVAKEAATIVLTDDNFATIVGAVKEGRVVYDNMRKFLAYIFAHLTPEVVPFAAFVLFGIPLPLVVMQILAIDLGTETLPALALGAEGAEPDIMKRPPRSRKERLIDMAMLARTWLFLGLIEAALVMGGFFWVLYSQGWQYGQELEETSHLYMQATTMTFAGIVATQVGTAIACRTNRASVFSVGFWSNRWLLWGIGFEIILLFLIVYVPVLQDVFATAGLEAHHWLLLAVFPVVILVSDELRKLMLRRTAGRMEQEGTS